MAILFDKLTTIVNTTLNTELSDCAAPAVSGGRGIVNSITKPKLPQQLIKYDAYSVDDQDQARFKRMFGNAPLFTADLVPVQCDIGGGVIEQQYVMRHRLSTGDIRGGYGLVCSAPDLMTCTSTPLGSCPTIDGLTGELNTILMDIPLAEKQVFVVSECLNNIMHIDTSMVYGEVLAETGVKLNETESLAMYLVKQVKSLLQKTQARVDAVQMWSTDGNGLVATATGAGSTGSGVLTPVNRGDLFSRAENYAVFRPNPSQASSHICRHPCDTKEYQLIGFVGIAIQYDHVTMTVGFTPAKFPNNATATPAVTLQSGDEIRALTNEMVTVTGGAFGGTTYNVYLPWGVAASSGTIPAGIVTGYTTLTRCCGYNGVGGSWKLWSEFTNATLTNNKYIGFDAGLFRNELIPDVKCCTTAGQVFKLTIKDIQSAIWRAATRIDQMKKLGWFGPSLSGVGIVVRANVFTMETLKENILYEYPKFTTTVLNYTADGRLPVQGREAGIPMIALDGYGYGTPMLEIDTHLPEGWVYVGPTTPYVNVVFSSLNDTYAPYNNGALVRRLPSNALGGFGPQTDYNAMKSQFVFADWSGGYCNQDKMLLNAILERYVSHANLLGGAETIWIGAEYRKPGDCYSVCTTPSCNVC